MSETPQANHGPSAIEIYNADGGETKRSGKRDCLCCGRPMSVTGMCVACANRRCSEKLEKPCKITGVVDPKDLATDFF